MWRVGRDLQPSSSTIPPDTDGHTLSIVKALSNLSVVDGPTDRRTDGPTDKQTNGQSLMECRQSATKMNIVLSLVKEMMRLSFVDTLEGFFEFWFNRVSRTCGQEVRIMSTAYVTLSYSNSNE